MSELIKDRTETPKLRVILSNSAPATELHSILPYLVWLGHVDGIYKKKRTGEGQKKKLISMF